MVTILSGPLTAKYAADWFTGVTEELAVLKPNWAAKLIMDDDRLKESGLREVAQQIAAELDPEHRVLPDDPARREYLISSFSRDVATAASMDATLHVTSLFEPLLRSDAKAIQTSVDPSGAAALGIVVPDVASLSWEAIAEFRDHHGSQEAREKLRAIEERVLTQEPGDAFEFQQRVGAEVTNELFLVIDELAGSLGFDMTKEVAHKAIAIVPFASEIASTLETTIAEIERRRAWYAALMKLRSAPYLAPPKRSRWQRWFRRS